MRILQSNQFQKQIKKLHSQTKAIVDTAVKEILANPHIGEAKVGDLEGVYVYKFRIHHQLMLLAYVFTPTSLTLLSLGSHENFYRDLKRLPSHHPGNP